jgi:hypothetical protein
MPLCMHDKMQQMMGPSGVLELWNCCVIYCIFLTFLRALMRDPLHLLERIFNFVSPSSVCAIVLRCPCLRNNDVIFEGQMAIIQSSRNG